MNRLCGKWFFLIVKKSFFISKKKMLKQMYLEQDNEQFHTTFESGASHAIRWKSLLVMTPTLGNKKAYRETMNCWPKRTKTTWKDLLSSDFNKTSWEREADPKMCHINLMLHCAPLMLSYPSKLKSNAMMVIAAVQ